MRFRTITALGAATALAALLAGPAAAGDTFRFKVSTSKLEHLTGARYEVWVVDGKKKHSAGTFNIRASGKQNRTRFRSPVDPREADAIAITIEPKPDAKKGPSATVVLAGAPKGNRAKLTFPLDLSNVSGSLITATPTDDSATNENAGLWFLDPAGPSAGLDIPTAPAGWAWESWGVTQGVPLSGGKFKKPSGADRSDRFSGPNAGPPFPGEDFLLNLPRRIQAPVNLADGASAAVLSLEPDQGKQDPTGPKPFSIKPLVAMIAAGQADHTSIQLNRDLSTVPKGNARF